MTGDSRWRVAVIGSGPSAFYAVEAILKADATARVDVFERLPVPFGLVRCGVAPDHQKIKSVTRIYEGIAASEGFRYFGNVQLGRDIRVEDLETIYDQIIHASGCESDNPLGKPGEDLRGVHSSTEFVGWYNGHPDHCDRDFALESARRVALIGNGNVAMDVARVLLQPVERLEPTDITDYAVDALRRSNVEEVYLIGRRGPAQAAFSPKEIAEIDAIDAIDVVVDPADVELDPLSATWLEEHGSRSQRRNVEFLQAAAGNGEGTAPKKLRCRFFRSPTEILGRNGQVSGLRLERMELALDETGTPRPRPTGAFEELDVDLVFKAIGYRGVPIPGVPFDERKGIIPNREGRVLDARGGDLLTGHYAVGWCKRGPTGLIGTNSACSKETVAAMIADREAGRELRGDGGDAAELLGERDVDAVFWADWQRFDAWERSEGEKRGKVRHKLARIEDMMRVIRDLRGPDR